MTPQDHSKLSKAVVAFQAMKEVLMDPEFAEPGAMVDHIESLVKRNQTLEADIASHLRSIAALQNQLDERNKAFEKTEARLEELSKEKNDLSTKLSEAYRDLKDERNKTARRETEWNEKLQEVVQALAAEHAERQRLAGFLVTLTDVSQSHSEM